MRKPGNITADFSLSVLQYLEAKLRDQDSQAVIEYYDHHRPELDTAEDSVAASILRLVTQAQSSLAQYKAALTTIRTAQVRATRAGESVLLAEIFMTLGSTLRDMGELKEATRAYQDAESLFRRHDLPEGRLRAINQAAGIHFRQNRFQRALELLLETAELATSLGDTRQLAYIMGNIGRASGFLGRTAEAEKHLKINIDLSTELGDRTDSAKAWLSLGQLYVQTAAYDQAEIALQNGYRLVIQERDRRHEVIHHTYLGELQYRRGELETARTTLERALAMAEQFGAETTLAARVMRHLAEVYVRMNNWRLAQKYASGSQIIYQNADNASELGALAKLKGQIEAGSAKSDKARKLFGQSLSLSEKAGVTFELASTLVTIAACSHYSDRERIGLLFRTEQICRRSGYAGLLQTVERMISALDARLITEPILCPGTVMPSVDFVTVCPALLTMKEQVALLGKADLPILLTGETGVGKDQMARYFHAQVRPGKPYVAVNCASVPATLLESELFGHTRGAFTGADSDKLGRFTAADSGVLFLDEIGEMDLTLQAKLLGVLERRKILPLGSTTEVDLDIKLVAATNRDLEAMVEQGLFRRDLYYRLTGITLILPPLRERKEDIPVLLEHFLKTHNLLPETGKLDIELARQFVTYDWPGNVRELINKVKRLQAMTLMVAEGDLVELSRALFADSLTESNETDNLFDKVQEFERKLITEALIAAGGNKSHTARLLGVHEATIRTKLRRYGICLDSKRSASTVVLE